MRIGAPNSKAVQEAQYALDQFQRVRSALQAAGVPANAAYFGALQTAHETNYYKDYKPKQINNYSGIKWINDKSRQNATPGPAGYAIYPSIQDWANDFKRIISFGARPIDASTIADYARRLKANNYYEDSVINYTAGLVRADKMYNGYIEAEAAVRNPAVHPAEIPGGPGKGDTAFTQEKTDGEGITAWIEDNPIKSALIGLAALAILVRR